MNSGSLNERITRALAFMLRHQPDEFDLELDRFGWGDLEDVLYALQERLGSTVDEDDVLGAIEASDRPRYEVEDGRIRALYGHSFPIDPGEPSEPPDELFIGVGSRDAARAEDRGLRSGRRAFLHLARTEEEARETGRRVAKDYAVVTVFAGEAYDDGVDFYDRGALFLADEIPVEFLEVGDIQHDGIDRDQGRRSRGRRTADGPRGPRRRRRRDDDDDRGDRGGRGHRGERDDRDERDDEPRQRRGRRSDEDRPAAKSAPRKERPAPEPREEEPAAEPATPGAGFGAGLVGGAQTQPEPAAEPEPVELQPAEPPASESADVEPEVDEREVDVPRAEPSSPPSGFGAGLD